MIEILVLLIAGFGAGGGVMILIGFAAFTGAVTAANFAKWGLREKAI
ncbi:MAG: hypothetical protein ABR547_08540 [Halanaerobium sp.]